MTKNTSYEILSDPQKRQIYDDEGLDGLSGGGGGFGGADVHDIFEQFFSGGGFSFSFGPGHGMDRQRESEDSVIPYDVTLEDLYNGKRVQMNIEREILCGSCQGYVNPYVLQAFPLTYDDPQVRDERKWETKAMREM